MQNAHASRNFILGICHGLDVLGYLNMYFPRLAEKEWAQPPRAFPGLQLLIDLVKGEDVFVKCV